jgi:hypothetical protein
VIAAHSRAFGGAGEKMHDDRILWSR